MAPNRFSLWLARLARAQVERPAPFVVICLLFSALSGL